MKTDKWIFNAEQIEAKQVDARNANPNKKEIEEIYKQIKILYSKISLLLSEDEKYLNILNWFANTTEKRAAASLMSNKELGYHFISIFSEHLMGQMDDAIFEEVLNRIGYKYPDELENKK